MPKIIPDSSIILAPDGILKCKIGINLSCKVNMYKNSMTPKKGYIKKSYLSLSKDRNTSINRLIFSI